MPHYNPDLSVVNSFVEELARAGVKDACIAPGSRSTPLTIAFARNPKLKVWTVLDERSAGFFAYGLARSTGTPVVLVCTSGTAPANFFPAVMEAYQSRVPLIVITADRPPELYGVGSNQTVDQEKLYGTFVKQYFSMPVPEKNELLSEHAKWTAHRIISVAISSSKGPVHVNWPFREPLLPPVEVAGDNVRGIYPKKVIHGVSRFEEVQLDQIAHVLKESKRGIIVCGPQDYADLATPLFGLAKTLGFPILADPLSQLRATGNDSKLLVDTYDVFLRSMLKFPANHPQRTNMDPELVIRLGNTPTSKVLGQYLNSIQGAKQVVIDDNISWNDPGFTASEVWQVNPVWLMREMNLRILSEGSTFADRWINMNQKTRVAIQNNLATLPDFFEGQVWLELAEMAPEQSVLFAGNSMPIRDMDSFFQVQHKKFLTFANRGASGIDGVVSSALGVSASGIGPVFLVIGDLSFHHDINGLMIAKMHNIPLIVILIHNDGGGIFSFLPQSLEQDVFPYFSTSHGIEFEDVARAYGGRYKKVSNWQEFHEGVKEALKYSGLHVLEIHTDRNENVRMHQQVFSACSEIVQSIGTEN